VLGPAEGLLVLRQRPAGFTLVEIAVVLAVLGMLFALMLPDMRYFVENRKLRSKVESMSIMMQQGRVQAIKLNQPVEFVTFDEPIDFSNPAFVDAVNPVNATANTGLNWALRTKNNATGQYDLIAARSGTEGAGQAGAIPTVTVTGDQSKITFTAMGSANPTATFNFASAAAPCAKAGPIRCLRLTVSLGGQIRMCDPIVDPATDPTINANDPRRC
jgi:type IV fimbrial biogenesis protein FimT